MDEYSIFEIDDLGFVLQEVYECLMNSYSSGRTRVKIFLRSQDALSYLGRWMAGWARRAGPGGIWRNSKGNYKNCFCNWLVILFHILLGEPVKHQVIMKKIHPLISRRQSQYGFGAVELVLVRDSSEPFPLESKLG